MFFSLQSAFPFYCSTRPPCEGMGGGLLRQRVIKRVSSFPRIKILNLSVSQRRGPLSFRTASFASLTDSRGG